MINWKEELIAIDAGSGSGCVVRDLGCAESAGSECDSAGADEKTVFPSLAEPADVSSAQLDGGEPGQMI